MKPVQFIGITGGSGSGKSALVRSLSEVFQPSQLSFLFQDNYYRPRENQKVDRKGIKNFDSPEAIDTELLLNDIRELKKGRTVIRPEYTFNNPDSEKIEVTIKPAPLVIMEGMYAMAVPEILNEVQSLIFIDVRSDLSLERRVKRDYKERGYDSDDVNYRYHAHFLPAYKQYILPLKEKASHVIDNNGNFSDSRQQLIAIINQFISC